MTNQIVRQLRRAPALLVFGAIGLLTLTAVLVVTLLAVRSHGISQLAIQTQDSAHALSVALRPFMMNPQAPPEDQQQQAIRQQILLRALGQSGNYRQLALSDRDGNTGFTYESPLITTGVPAWFTSLVEIDAPKYRAEITVGWDIAGFIRVSRQPAPVYRMLWRCAQGIVGTGFAGLILALMLASIRARAVDTALPRWADLTRRADAQDMRLPEANARVQSPLKDKAEYQNIDTDHEPVTEERDT